MNEEHRVVFLTEREDAKKEPIPGVRIKNFSLHRQVSNDTHHYLQTTEEAVIKGQGVLRELSNLVEEGFNPKIVITHAGMGLGLFIKDFLPETILISYFEWYFTPHTTKDLVREFNLDTQLKTGLRNIPILQELESCDQGVVPTEWQKSQFPKAYQHKLEIIFDGIDTTFFHPHPEPRKLQRENQVIRNRDSGEIHILPMNCPIISYATRGMEPIRGFPEFMRSLPKLLENIPELRVIIAGADRRAYSYDSPSHQGSWKDYLLDEMGDFKGRQRINFTGLLNYEDYRKLLWRTNLHCYFTRAYVTSWSLFEAASCGASLAVNRCPATAHIIENNSATWIDLEGPEGLTKALNQALQKETPKASKIFKGFELSTSLKQWEYLINQALQSS